MICVAYVMYFITYLKVFYVFHITNIMVMYLYVYTCIYIYIYMYTYAYIYIYTYAYIYTCIYIYIYNICMYIYICIYILVRLYIYDKYHIKTVYRQSIQSDMILQIRARWCGTLFWKSGFHHWTSLKMPSTSFVGEILLWMTGLVSCLIKTPMFIGLWEPNQQSVDDVGVRKLPHARRVNIPIFAPWWASDKGDALWWSKAILRRHLWP